MSRLFVLKLVCTIGWTAKNMIVRDRKKQTNGVTMVKTTACFLTALFFCILLPTVARAFIHQVSYNGELLVRRRNILFTSTPDQQTAKSFSNPSQAFGKPLSSETREFNSSLVSFLKNLLFDTAFGGEKREYARFYALETIARMPYFSYLSVLHLYETLGWWRKAKYLKIHFAESWNEMHHLLIMEELGGSHLWKDRFVAQHAAFFYYWIAVVLYILNPTMAYNINQCVEEHAYTTYDTFLRDHEDELKMIVAPDVAIQYYRDGDLYMFDEAQTNTNGGPRRPIINNLYDVFVAIRDDELDHVKTMAALQQDVELVSSNGEKCKADSEEVFGTA